MSKRRRAKRRTKRAAKRTRRSNLSSASKKSPKRFKVFVSHASADTWVAQQIAKHIKAAGAECFLDVVDLHVGEDFEERIRDAMDNCSELLVLLTPSSLKSKYVWLEIGAAWGQRKHIVGVLYGVSLKDIQKGQGNPVLLKRVILVEINDSGRYYKELRRRAAKKHHG